MSENQSWGNSKDVQNGAFKAWEVFYADFMMTTRMYLHQIVILAFVQSVLIAILMIIFIPKLDKQLMFSYWLAKVSRVFFMNPSFTLDLPSGSKTFSAAQIVGTPLAESVAHKSTLLILLFFLLTLGIYYLVIPITKKLNKKGTELFAKEHVKGAMLLTEEMLIQAIKKSGEYCELFIGNIPWPWKFGPEHLAVLGKTQVGKTVLMFQLLEQMRGSKAMVLDVKNDYVSKWYDPAKGDLLFNVLDERCIGWNIFNELESLMDVDAIAASIIPDTKGGGNEQFFQDAARAVCVGGLHICIQRKTKKMSAFRDTIFQNTENLLESIEKVKAGRRGAQFIQQPASALAGSVIAVLTQHLSWLDYISDKDGDFSFVKWLTDGKPGFLIISSNDKVEKVLRPIISLAFDLIARQVNSLPDNRDNRIYLVMDEFGTLQRLSAIEQLLTKGGGKGLVCVLTCQDLAQIEEKYGRNLVKTILNSFGSLVTLKLVDPDTAEYTSKSYAKQEYWESCETVTMKASGEAGDGRSIARQKRDESIISAAQIIYLEKLEFYLRIPNHYPCKSKLEIKPINNILAINEAFIVRKGLALTEIYKRNAEIEKTEGDSSIKFLDDVSLDNAPDKTLTEPEPEKPKIKKISSLF